MCSAITSRYSAGAVLAQFVAVRVHHAHLAVVEIDLVVLIHQTHVIGLVA